MRGQQERRDGGDHAHPQFARQRLAGALHQVGQLLGLAQQAVRLGHHRIAQRGEAHRALGPLDQHHAQQGFQIAQPGRQRRLRDETGVGGAAEMAMLVQRNKVLQLLERGQVRRSFAQASGSADSSIGTSGAAGSSTTSSTCVILSLPLDHREGQLAFDQIERVAGRTVRSASLRASAGPRARPAASSSSSSLRASRRDGDVDLAAADLEQQLEQVGDQRAFLAQGAPRGVARRAFRRRAAAWRLASAAISRAPMSLSVQPGRQPAHLGEIGLALGRMAGDIGQRFVLDDAAARDVLVLRLELAPARPAPSAGRAPPDCGSAALIRCQACSGSLR